MRFKSILFPIILFVLASGMYFVTDDYYHQILFMVFLYAGIGFAWNLVGGYAGQLSLGHAAFFGIGAYTYALLSPHIGPIPALIIGGLLGAISASPIGWICFRLRGPYFALATIAVAELLNVLATNQFKDLTQGAAGLLVSNLVSDPSMYYWVAIAFMFVSFIAMSIIVKSKIGYYLMAIREDEDTAQTITINTTFYKLLSLVISAFFTAIGGAIFAANLGNIQPNDVFGGNISNQIVFLSILGGVGTIYGPLVGAFILEFASDWLKSYIGQVSWISDPNAFAFFIYGLLIVLVVMFMPTGIVGAVLSFWRKRRERT